MRCHNQIAVLSFMPGEVICFRFLFWAVLSSLSMAKASVTLPADVLKAARPARCNNSACLTYVTSSVALAQHLCSFCFVFVASGACLQGSHLGARHLINGV